MRRVDKLKNVLRKFLNNHGMIVMPKDIESMGSWHEGEFKVKNRYYHVDSLNLVSYGDPWYEYHEYEDYGKFRVSLGYHFYGGHGIWFLSLGGENVYTWKHRTMYYKKKSDAQLNRIVDSYINEYKKHGSPGNANIEVLRRTIRQQLGGRYLRRWYDK